MDATQMNMGKISSILQFTDGLWNFYPIHFSCMRQVDLYVRGGGGGGGAHTNTFTLTKDQVTSVPATTTCS